MIRQLEILGEAAGRVSRETCILFGEIPWQRVTGLRHRLIHDYLGVDVQLVWRVVTVEIPKIVGQIEIMLEELTRSHD